MTQGVPYTDDLFQRWSAISEDPAKFVRLGVFGSGCDARQVRAYHQEDADRSRSNHDGSDSLPSRRESNLLTSG